MKIEMGESLVYSWLRHEKQCQLVQTNWKVSPCWKLGDRRGDVEEIFESCRRYFEEKHSFDLSKDCGLEQFLKQAEIDAVGIVCSREAPRIYAADVAYHGGGLNYKGKEGTVLKITQKCVRTALCVYGYFGLKSGEILFISPKIAPAIQTELALVFDEITALLKEHDLDFTVDLYCNERFYSQVMVPVVDQASCVADTSELFMRSIQLYQLGAKTEHGHPEGPRVVTIPRTQGQDRNAIRMVPLWADAPDQNPHRIIRAFFQLQRERNIVTRPELVSRCQDSERHPDVYVEDFERNFKLMKKDKGEGHRVFNDDGYNITICPEVRDTLEQYRPRFASNE